MNRISSSPRKPPDHALACYTEIKEGRGTPNGGVLVDVSHLPREMIMQRLPRGCHNRSDYPALDPSLQVNLVWSGPGCIERESIPPIPHEIAALMREVSTVGKLVE